MKKTLILCAPARDILRCLTVIIHEIHQSCENWQALLAGHSCERSYPDDFYATSFEAPENECGMVDRFGTPGLRGASDQVYSLT